MLDLFYLLAGAVGGIVGYWLGWIDGVRVGGARMRERLRRPPSTNV